MDLNDFISLTNAVVGGGANSNVISFNPFVLKVLLNSDTDRGAPTPDANDKMWTKSAFKNQFAEFKRIFQQLIRCNK